MTRNVDLNATMNMGLSMTKKLGQNMTKNVSRNMTKKVGEPLAHYHYSIRMESPNGLLQIAPPQT